MNATGHMLVARIAWDKMTPAARSAVQDLASDPNNPSTGIPTTEKNSDQFTGAVWMDDIKPVDKELHFVSTPFKGDGTVPVGPSSVTFLNDNLALLKSPSASRDQKAEALRMTLHLMGDTHQPLHNCENGDRGGNNFKLDGRNNLHSFWDTGGNQWTNLKRPLNDQASAQLASMASKVEQECPEAELAAKVQDLNPADWSHEGWELSHTAVYEGVVQGKAPSPEYVARAQHTMNEEAALAGYRLASIVNSIFH
jgi:nuclease S1